jgi:hypothetical protein
MDEIWWESIFLFHHIWPPEKNTKLVLGKMASPLYPMRKYVIIHKVMKAKQTQHDRIYNTNTELWYWWVVLCPI